jgi:hypothetical protein
MDANVWKLECYWVMKSSSNYRYDRGDGLVMGVQSPVKAAL